MGHVSFCVVYVRAADDVIPSGILHNLDSNYFIGSQIKEEEVEINQKMEADSTLENQIQEAKVEKDLVTEVQFHLESTESISPTQIYYDKDPDPEENTEHLSFCAEGNIPSVSSVRSSTAASLLGSRRQSSSTASSSEEVMLASSVGLASSHGRLSSCSTVIVMEEQLMLNPTKSEVGSRSYM